MEGLKDFKPGNFYRTRGGLMAKVERIGITSAKNPGPFPLTGWVEDLLNKSKPLFESWTVDGKVYNDGSDHRYDLVGPWTEEKALCTARGCKGEAFPGSTRCWHHGGDQQD